MFEISDRWPLAVLPQLEAIRSIESSQDRRDTFCVVVRFSRPHGLRLDWSACYIPREQQSWRFKLRGPKRKRGLFDTIRLSLGPEDCNRLDKALAGHKFRENIVREGSMPTAAFSSFLLELPEMYQEEPYRHCCAAYKLKGRRAGKVPRYLYRIVDADDFADRLWQLKDDSLEQSGGYLHTFRGYAFESRRKILSKAHIGRPGGPIFATFSLADGDPIDELSLDAPNVRNVLGLPFEGELASLEYESENFADILIPTVADGSTHQNFRPAPPGSQYGWTLNLVTRQQAPIKRGERADPTRSLPEVVHCSHAADIIVDALPRLLIGKAGPLPSSGDL